MHIHSPASFHWNGGKQLSEMNDTEKEQSFQKMLDTINGSDVEVFAITDYWTFDGYIGFKKYIKAKNLTLNKTVFPGMELRVEAPVNHRLNVQVILSDELTDQQLNDFKAKLMIPSIGNRSLSDDALRAFAKTLDDSKAKTHGFAATSTLDDTQLFQLGSKTALVSKESLCTAAFSAIPPKTGYILMPYDTSDGLKDLDWSKHPHDDNYFMQSAHLFESRNDESIDLFLGRETDKNKAFLHNFQKTLGGNPKPVVSGSDAHKIEDYGNYPSGKITWIKADPTFLGLTQVINEPAERVFVGTMPAKLLAVNDNKAKHIASIKISHTTPSTTPAWFGNDLPLNSGLVAIIGKKGSGKSALADIVSLCGDSSINPKEYSFLTPAKFKKRSLAKSYEATLTWLDNETTTTNLDGAVDAFALERVKYLPQQYVENICNEEGVSTLFQAEIDKVIFSYVPDENRLGAQSLAELIKLKTENADESLTTKRDELHRLNEQVASIEEKEIPQYLESIEKKLEEKKRELKNLEKPKEVKEPAKTVDKATEAKIKKLTDEVTTVESEITTSRDALRDTNDKLQKLKKISDGVETLEGKLSSFIDEQEENAKELSIDLAKVISLKVSKSVLKTKQDELSTKKEELDAKLEQNNPKSKNSLYNKKAKLEGELKAITATLDADQKLYKEYLQAKKEYEAKQQAITGKKGDTSLETIVSLEIEIDYVKTKLNGELQKLYKKRSDITKKLFETLQQKIEFYKEIYTPLVKFIESEKETQKQSGSVLNFTAGILFDKQKFADEFFGYVNQARDGSFQSSAGGQKMLNDIIEKYDFANTTDMASFLDDVLDHLKNDKTSNTGKTNHIQAQLKKDKGMVGFYDLLFSLGYLDVKYKILFNDKDLNANEFSPGEKGTLLLIFYLLIDKENIPLVIDQPEENLDNESVYTLLVPYIKKAKARRQIIAVTHNPNLAVVCDAEQIICTSMDKKKNEIRYESGSIEDVAINKRIVDILEGTLPAFTVRDKKYIRSK